MNEWNIYLNKLDADKKKTVKAMLNAFQECIPHAQATMSYGVPALAVKGRAVIAVAAFKNHLGIYPFDPKVVSQLQAKLSNAETSKGALKFSFQDLPTKKQIKTIATVKLKSLEQQKI